MIKLKELFDTPAIDVKKSNAEPWEEEDQKSYEFSLPSKTGESMDYRVTFHFGYAGNVLRTSKYDDVKSCSVEFFAKKSGYGNAFYTMDSGVNSQPFKVFSMVWKIIEKFLETHNISIFFFSSNKAEHSRRELYKKFADMINAKTQWKLMEENTGGSLHIFVFAIKEIADDYKKNKGQQQ